MMNSMKSLEEIFEDLNFTDKEKDGFNEAVQVAKNYMRNGDVDMAKEFQFIVERVASDEI